MPVEYGPTFNDDERPRLPEDGRGSPENWTSIGWKRQTDYAVNSNGQEDLSHTHEFYFDGVRLPQTPSKFTIKNTDNTEVMMMNDEEPFTLLHKDGVFQLDFEFKLTDRVLPYQWHTDDVQHSKDYWYRLFYTRKMQKEPIEVCILRLEYDHYFCPCIVQDYSFTEDAEDNNDWTVSVSMIEYHPQRNQEIDTEITHHLTQNRVNALWRSGRGE